MKKLVLSAIFMLSIAFSVFSQKPLTVGLFGGFGGPFMNVTFLDAPSFSVGGGGAALLTKNIFLGGFGQSTSSINPINSKIAGFENYKIETEMGGLWIGYILRTKYIDFSFSGKSAWGHIYLDDTNIQTTIYDDISVLTPSFEIEKRIGGITKISLGVFYNFYNGVNIVSYNNSDFSAPGISLNLKFGYF